MSAALVICEDPAIRAVAQREIMSAQPTGRHGWPWFHRRCHSPRPLFIHLKRVHTVATLVEQPRARRIATISLKADVARRRLVLETGHPSAAKLDGIVACARWHVTRVDKHGVSTSAPLGALDPCARARRTCGRDDDHYRDQDVCTRASTVPSIAEHDKVQILPVRYAQGGARASG